MIADIAGRARAASPVWAAALREEPTGEAAYGPRVDDRFALGVETIYEGYLVHHADQPAVRTRPTASRRSCSATTSTRRAWSRSAGPATSAP